MFVQIHTLTGYSGVLLNRDDSGLAKRMPYGGATRTRTSSQFAKRKIRTAEGPFAISNIGDVSVRSRETFKREVAKPLVDAGLDRTAVIQATVVMMDAIFPPSKGGEKERKDKLAKIERGELEDYALLERGEINVLSRAEIEFVRDKVAEFVKATNDAEGASAAAAEYVKQPDHKKNLRAAGEAMSLDVAMFGRMVTGDSLSTVDAAVHVAHAMTTHGQQNETDFFTAVDDLVTGAGDNGSGHMGETEITSPMLYGYYVVDINQLLDNLKGLDNSREVAAQMAGNLVRLVAQAIVGAKKGATAPYSSADFLMIEVSTDQPRTLAEAFRTPCKPTLEDSVAALKRYVSGKDAMYGFTGQRWVASSVEAGLGEQVTVPQIAERVVSALNG